MHKQSCELKCDLKRNCVVHSALYIPLVISYLQLSGRESLFSASPRLETFFSSRALEASDVTLMRMM